MRFTVRKTKDKDLVMDLQKNTLPADKPFPFEGSEWWTVYHDGEGIGFGGYFKSLMWEHTIYLCRSGISEKYRGNGLQKRLIVARIKYAKSQGIKWAYTDTRDNPASSNSLISCGFKVYRPDYAWGFRDTIYWRRAI